jgi:hypothetical protein
MFLQAFPRGDNWSNSNSSVCTIADVFLFVFVLSFVFVYMPQLFCKNKQFSTKKYELIIFNYSITYLCSVAWFNIITCLISNWTSDYNTTISFSTNFHILRSVLDPMLCATYTYSIMSMVMGPVNFCPW